MVKKNLIAVGIASIGISTVNAGELGIGRDNDIPDAGPGDPVVSPQEAAGTGFLAELLQWFDIATANGNDE